MKLIDSVNDLWGDDLKDSIKPGSKLKIAASCFSIYAYEALKKELKNIDSVEFIFTKPSFVPNAVAGKINKARREFHIPKQQRERSLCGSEFEIHLKNKLTQKAIAKECANWIRKKATFRSNTTEGAMQQFAYLSSDANTISYSPLNGFTAVDLGYQPSDATSNFIQKVDEPAYTKTYIDLFNKIWDDNSKLKDVTESICTHIESVYKENSPEKIYFLMLYNIFNEFLEDLNEDVLPNDKNGYKDSIIWNKLYNFQTDAATGIINKLENYNGCILADSVGLGKTFTALAVIKYYELRNRSVLVLCPKKLEDNWLNYNHNLKTNIFANDRFNYDVLCHTDLQRTRGDSNGISLSKINWGNYDLVVIDESHNFRNNHQYKGEDTRYSKLMNQVIRAGVKTKVLMLSATPVNNRFDDLRNQLALAYEGESKKLSSKLRNNNNIEKTFKAAQTVFNKWSKSPLEQRTSKSILDKLDFNFFELLDSVTIARSRKHIATFYDTTDIRKFPDRKKPLSFRPPLTELKSVMSFNDIFDHLVQVKQAVYTPLLYVFDSKKYKYENTSDEQKNTSQFLGAQIEGIKKLMTINLLKRLESSVDSFRITLENMKTKIGGVLNEIEQYQTTRETNSGNSFSDYKSFAEINAEYDEEAADEIDTSDKKPKIEFADIDLTLWKNDLVDDQTLILILYEEMQKITVANDSKLQHLKSHIEDKIDQPINPGNKKIVIFTAFADTANYLYKNLAPELQKIGIHSGRVTGSKTPKTTLINSDKRRGYDFQSVLTLFSPISKEKQLILPDETGEIDVLIGTDCIAEGQNLQDCDYLINYDIHWNPVRIIQRFGRIDRIGSTNDCIQLVNYWPDISLDEYINLKERVESRMHIVDLAGTGDDNVLSAKATDVSYRKEQLRSLQDEVIEIEDLKTGVNITDLGLNDFRMDLLNYIKTNGDLDNLPNGLHAVVPAKAEIGLTPGVIFTLRNRNSSVNINQHNRLHPYYLLYIGTDGQIIIDHTQVKTLLDLVRSCCKGADKPIPAVCKLFNASTKDGRNMDNYSELLGQAITSMLELKEDKDIDSLFTSANTTALVDTIKGLEDFELIAFLVISQQDAK